MKPAIMETRAREAGLFWPAAGVAAWTGFLFLAVYHTCNWITAQRPDVSVAVFQWERVHIGHHCDISPRATFIGPCWIGSRCTIRAATIGPYAVVSDDCVIAHGAEIAHSYLTAGAVAPPRARMAGIAAGPGGVIAHATGERLLSVAR